MIEFNDVLKTLLEEPAIESFLLFRIYDKNESILYTSTTFYSDLQMTDSGLLTDKHSYSSDGKILAIDPPGLDGKVDRELYKIVLSDPDRALINYAKSHHLIGFTMEIRFGFVDNSGKPLKELSNTLIVYRGLIEGVSALIDANEFGEVKVEVKGSSPVANLDFKNCVYMNKEERARTHPHDTCCEEIFASSESITIRWGRGVNDA